MAQRVVIERALVELGQQLVQRLAPDGWVSRPAGRGGPGSATMTRETQAGVVATAWLGRAGFRIPDGWPVELRLRLGVGYGPALDLSALLTVHPVLDVVPNPATTDSAGMPFELVGEAGIPGLADRIAAVVDEHAVAFAERFPDADALIAGTGAGAAADRPGRHAGPAPAAGELASIDDLTLLAAAGHRDRVTSLLTAFDEPTSVERRLHRRFVRQLRRWLDAGEPPIPPAEQTLARLPRPAAPADRPWAAAREVFGSSRSARAAVRAGARGKSVDELLRALEVEYSRRAIPTRTSDLAAIAQRLHDEQQPLGRTRQRVRDVRSAAAAGVTVVRFLRSARDEQYREQAVGNFLEQLTGEDPEWLRPPDRAAYPIAAAAPTEPATVLLDDGTDDLLARVTADARRRLSEGALVDLWFSQQSAPAGAPTVVVAHIGAHRVGIVPTGRAAPFAEIFGAAAFFDEDPWRAAPSAGRQAGRGTWSSASRAHPKNTRSPGHASLAHRE